MSTPKTASIWDSFNAKAKEQILSTVKGRYFPEIWYVLENWLQTVKHREALEVGYGIGMVGEALAKSGWAVTMTDPSVAAMNTFKERFAKMQLKAAFAVSEGGKLPFATGSQEVVVAINSLEFAPDRRALLTEIARVLKPSGRAAIVVFNSYGPWGLPLISQQLRLPPRQQAGRLFTKREFTSLLTACRLEPTQVLERAYYLPFAMPGNVRIKLPLPGAFVALIKGSTGSRNRRGHKENSPHSAPSAEAKKGLDQRSKAST